MNCPLHHVPLLGGWLCSVCDTRESFLIHGNVKLFDKGFVDAIKGRPNKAVGTNDHVAYETGWKAGQNLAPHSAPKRVCGECKHFVVYRNKLGKEFHNRPGNCGWRPKIKLAMAIRCDVQECMTVWKNTSAKKCACFKPKK